MELCRILWLALLLSGTASAAAKDEVFAAWDAMFDAGAYRATIETTVNNQVFQQTIDVVLPGRMRMMGGPGGDMVVTPDGAWMKLPGEDHWIKAPASTASVGQQFLSRDFINQAKAGVQSVESLGVDQINGQSVRIYRVQQTMSIVGNEVSSNTRLFVDTASGRPLRQEIESTAMGRNSRTVQTLQYLPDLKIVAPQ